MIESYTRDTSISRHAVRLEVYTSIPDLESSLGLSPFLLNLDLDSDLGRFVTKSTFNFHCVAFAVFCLDCTTFGQPVRYTRPKITVTYLIFTAELTRAVRSVTLNLANKFSQCTFSVAEHYDLFSGLIILRQA